MERDLFPVVVHVLLVSDCRLFLLRRANTGFLDGYYALPGGHQHRGESVSEAALRECAEETGVRPGRIEPVCVLAYRSDRDQGLNFVFEARDWNGAPEIAEPELFDGGGWYPIDALPDPHVGWIPHALRLRGSERWYQEFHWD